MYQTAFAQTQQQQLSSLAQLQQHQRPNILLIVGDDFGYSDIGSMISTPAMIENMDKAIGKVIKLLKDTRQYDNTLIMFTSDNGGSEPAPLLSIKFSSRNAASMVNYLEQVNNTLSNIGNGSSIVNYAAWGSASSVSPLSGFKTTEYEGGTRAPFVVKEPQLAGSNTSATTTTTSTTAGAGVASNRKIIKAFAYVNDITPTILDYAGS